ncbi:MAG: RNA polymerase sigma factor [Spirochaetales bacterium]|nr:RNA polymerase sigma factor [Spirochaetales bacterium]MCF7937194.1 RNA polymerase sigma factor [Spirochaetales bacterium]
MSIEHEAISFTTVYQTLFHTIFSIAYRITGNMTVAEEISQESFLKYYEKAPDLPDLDQARYWLIRVTKNLCYNNEKRKAREKRAYQRALREPERPNHSGEDLFLHEESKEEVQRALNEVPYNLRSVLVLKEYGQLNYRQIGNLLGISESNVKVRVYRGREKLAELLKRGEQ